MKKLISIVVAFALVFIWMAGGCAPFGDGGKQEPKLAALERSIKPVPAFIAGTWTERAEEPTWLGIVIEPNGIVSSAVIPFQVWLRPHQTTRKEMLDGSISTYTGGDMFAEYDPQTRELFVFIELKNFQVKYHDILTGGSRIDRFTGRVSEDGKVWRPSCVSVFDYGPELSMDANAIEPVYLIFDKVEK